MAKPTTNLLFGMKNMGLFTRSAIALAVMGTTIAGFGCDKADDKMDVGMNKAAGEIRIGEASAASSTVSPLAKEQLPVGRTLGAKFMLGNAKSSEAAAKTLQLNALYLDASQLISELNLVNQALGVGNTLVAGYRQQDPAEARKLIKTRIGEAEGTEGKTILLDGATTPTIPVAKKKLEEAQAAVTAKESEIKSFEADRKTAILKADDLMAKAQGVKGKEGVAAFSTAADARKDVSLVSSKIDQANNDLIQLKIEQSLAEGQVKVLEGYVVKLKEQDAAMADSFAKLGEQIAAQQGVSKTAVEEPAKGEFAMSVTAKSDQLAGKLAEIDKLEAEIGGLLTEAAAAYGESADEATKFGSDIQSALGTNKGEYETKILDRAGKATPAATFRLQDGLAKHQLAELYANKAVALAARERIAKGVAETLKVTDLKVPASLTAGSTAADALKKATDAFEDADKSLDQAANGIQGGDKITSSRRNATASARMYLNYGWSQLLNSTGDAKAAKEKLDAAKGYRDSMVSDGAVLADLPGELLLPVMKTPATTPAEAAPTTDATPPATATEPAAAAPATPATPAPAAPAPAAP